MVDKPYLNHGCEYRECAGADADGATVLDYLQRRYPKFAREEWLKRIASGRVLVDRARATPDMILRPGRKLAWLRPPWGEPEVPLDFAVLHRDEHVLAVAKPPGLPTLPGGGEYYEHTLLWLVRRHFPEAKPMHRLGRGTSGITLFARTRDAGRALSTAWQRGEVLKVYRALLSGLVETDELVVDTPIGPVPHPLLGTVYAASAAGKPAHSHVRVLERRECASVVEVRIATGRPHQIRIHMAAAGFPLTGDPLYARGGLPIEGSRALPGDTGYLLHAERLGFTHPATGQWVAITCLPPPPLRLRPRPRAERCGI